MLLGQRLDLFHGHVAGHHEDGVVGRVMLLVEGHRLVVGVLGDLLRPADDRAAVGVIEIERRAPLLAERAVRRILHHLPALLEHHVALREHALGGGVQVAHPVGFHAHHQVEPVGGDALEIGGVIGRGEGVVVAAVLRDDPAELAVRQLVGRLEHQMLEEMRDARLPRRLVGRSDPVPDHVGDHRRTAVLDHHPHQPVVEGEALDVIGGRRDGESGRDDQGGTEGGKELHATHLRNQSSRRQYPPARPDQAGATQR